MLITVLLFDYRLPEYQSRSIYMEGIIKEKYELGGELHDNRWYGLRVADAVSLPEGAAEEIQ